MATSLELAFGFIIEHHKAVTAIWEEDPDTGNRTVIHVIDKPEALSEAKRNRLAWQWLRERAVKFEAAAEALELFLPEDESEN